MNRLISIVPLLVVALGVLAPVTTAPAQADPIGGVIVIPGSGSDLTGIRVRTSAGCPAKADAYYATVKGRGFPPDGQIVTSNTSASISHSFGFDAYFMMIMRDYATKNNTTLGGRYDITVFCIDSFTIQKYGEFTGSMEFTSPTHYEALGAAKPIGSPPPPLKQAADGSAIAPDPAPPSTTTPPRNGDQQPGAPAQGGNASPPTGAPPGTSPYGSTAIATPAPTSTSQPPSESALGAQKPASQASAERHATTAQSTSWLILVGVVLAAGVVILTVMNRIRKRRSG